MWFDDRIKKVQCQKNNGAVSEDEGVGAMSEEQWCAAGKVWCTVEKSALRCRKKDDPRSQ